VGKIGSRPIAGDPADRAAGRTQTTRSDRHEEGTAMRQDMIGIVGVGLMGHGIASSIQRSGREIAFVDHPGNQPTGDLEAAGAEKVATPAALAALCNTLVLCVTGSPQVEAVLVGQGGVLEGLRPGAVVIDCSTAIPDSTRRMAAAVEAAGGRMLDAPMTRTPKEAAEGRLNLLVGGDADLFEACLPLLRSFAENVTHAGPVGSGHVMKLLHNYVSLGFSAVLCEAAAAAGKAGIDPATFHAVLAQGGGKGVVLDRLAPFVLEGDTGNFRFSIANAAKDIGYYGEMVAALGGAAGIANAIGQAYRGQVEAGEGERFVPEMIRLLS
jgi:3-hydroxyisobutyrate dehydrogenase-like beta-hydroxyacid dehydrogenase